MCFGRNPYSLGFFQSSSFSRSLIAILIAALRLGYIPDLTNSSSPFKYSSGKRTDAPFTASPPARVVQLRIRRWSSPLLLPLYWSSPPFFSAISFPYCGVLGFNHDLITFSTLPLYTYNVFHLKIVWPLFYCLRIRPDTGSWETERDLPSWSKRRGSPCS